LDQFVGWVHHIATEGLTTLYQGTDAGPVTFGPVMAYVWAVLAAIQPAFQSVTDASDPAIRMLMKTPASLADFGLAALVAWALRDRPRWAVLAALAVLLVPAVPYVSAWWGQYESIFVLSGLGAALAAARGRNGLAAVLVAVSLCTKPQALPFVLPFAAWFWATGYARDGVRGGVLELVRTGLVGLATLVVLWLPFIPHGGPGDYLSNLAYYQNEIFSTLSLRAWNAWSLVQDLAVGGQFVVDDVPIIGPITMRHIGYAVTGLLSLTIGLAIIRDPRPRTLILGLSASVLAFFCFMTQMHERYAYAAVILLILLLPERRVAWSWVALATVFSLNLIAAIPPDLEPGSVIPVTGIVGIIGALAMIAIFVVTLRLVRSEPGHPGDGSV
jgi:Gpi18-like mannosyltransferase